MDGAHDLGGRQGFGPVAVVPDEPVFAEPWEATARALAMVVAGATAAGGGGFRHSIERMHPVHYLTSSYYEHWLTSAATLAVEHGLVTAEALEARAGGPVPLARPVHPRPLGAAADAAAAAVPSPTVAVGDRVRVLDRRPPGHTRCPWYVRGRTGTVVRLDGAHPVPDLEAHGGGQVAELTCSVRFDAAELWDDAEPGVAVHVDLWARYLEVAQ